MFTVDAADLAVAHTFAVSCIPSGATVIFNVPGQNVTIQNMGMQSLKVGYVIKVHKMYLNLNAIPEIKKLSSSDRKKIKLRIFQDASIGTKIAVNIIISIFICISVSVFAKKYGVHTARLEVVMYISFFISLLLGHLCIVNFIIVPRVRSYKL